MAGFAAELIQVLSCSYIGSFIYSDEGANGNRKIHFL